MAGEKNKNDWEVQCPRCKQVYILDLTNLPIVKGSQFQIPCGNTLHKEVGCGAIIKIEIDEQ